MANYFTDRVVEHPGRVTLTPTGGSNEYDIDRSEGTVTTAGTPFNATTFNGMLDQYGAWYGTCSTAAGTSIKEVVCPGFTLVSGSTIAVHFDYGNQYDGSISLNVNSTGGKYVVDYGQYYYSNGRCAWDADQVILFTYNGSNWEMISGPIITGSQLGTVETSLGISSNSKGRLSAILNTIASAVKTTTVSITTSNSSTIYGKRFGNVYSIIVDDTGSVPSGAWTQIGQLNSSSDYPSVTSSMVGVNGSVNGVGKITVNNSGVVRVFHSLGSNQNFYGTTITYIK